MTKEEEEELKRLEVNLFRLVEKVSEQKRNILELKRKLQDSNTEIEYLKNINSQLEKKCLITSTMVSMSEDVDEKKKMESFLDDMIRKVDVCIKQIEAI